MAKVKRTVKKKAAGADNVAVLAKTATTGTAAKKKLKKVKTKVAAEDEAISSVQKRIEKKVKQLEGQAPVKKKVKKKLRKTVPADISAPVDEEFAKELASLAQAAAAAEEDEEQEERRVAKPKKVKKRKLEVSREAEAALPAKDEAKKRAVLDESASGDEAPSTKNDGAKDGAEDEFKVFVGGLPFVVEEKTVQKTFRECGEIKRFDMPSKDGRPMGCAFVYYRTQEGMDKALELDGTDYHGRYIKVKRPQDKEEYLKSRDDERSGVVRGAPELTVFVGGLSWDTDIDVLRKDFAECGEIEALRMAKRDDGTSKGMAFIAYRTMEAVNAALAYNGDDYGGRTIKVSMAEQKAKGDKGDGKGKSDGKGKGKGKGKDKGSGFQQSIVRDSRKRICHRFTQGTCCFGENCRFLHASKEEATE